MMDAISKYEKIGVFFNIKKQNIYDLMKYIEALDLNH